MTSGYGVLCCTSGVIKDKQCSADEGAVRMLRADLKYTKRIQRKNRGEILMSGLQKQMYFEVVAVPGLFVSFLSFHTQVF